MKTVTRLTMRTIDNYTRTLPLEEQRELTRSYKSKIGASYHFMTFLNHIVHTYNLNLRARKRPPFVLTIIDLDDEHFERATRLLIPFFSTVCGIHLEPSLERKNTFLVQAYAPERSNRQNYLKVMIPLSEQDPLTTFRKKGAAYEKDTSATS